MVYLLNNRNIGDYLSQENLCLLEEINKDKIELKPAKNFNLLVTLNNGRQLLVKQERHDKEGKTSGEFVTEWRIHESIQNFPELEFIRSQITEVIHFDRTNSIVAIEYLGDYQDLAEFYYKENQFPPEIAKEIGTTLAEIHRATFEKQKYQEFFTTNGESESANQTLNIVKGLERIGPEIFGIVPADAIKFYSLYQRYDSLGKAIGSLLENFKPCCLTHNDLKLNNILLNEKWQEIDSKSSSNAIKIIDWERNSWGDPACDLGMLVASYLQNWLGSLVVSQSIAIEESLRLAQTPLELIQPSLAAVSKAYLSAFPEILDRRPDFIERVVQFTGFALIQQIQAIVQYQKTFGNEGICMLQVAKTLLCRPQQSIPTVFGTTKSELTNDSIATVV